MRSRRFAHPLLRGIVLGAVCVLAAGVAAWRLGYIRLKPSGTQPAAPARTVADVHRASLDLQPPALQATTGSAARRRLATATDAAVGELSGAAGSSVVSWDPSTGLWDYAPEKEETALGQGRTPTWWQSALAMDAVVRYATAERSVAPFYQNMLATVYEHNVSKPGTYAPQDFENNYNDDTAWWGIAWLHAAEYELRVVHDDADAAQYLAMAEDDARFLANQPRRCGRGGIEFRPGYAPNTITDAEYVDLVAQLAQMRSGTGALANLGLARQWSADARQTLHWLETSGLVDLSTGAVRWTDGSNCRPEGGSQTYTEGEFADALTQMRILTGNPAYTNQAAVFLDRVLDPAHGMLADGVLQEQCEALRNQCLRSSYNITVFKGLFDDAVADWTRETHSTVFDAFLAAQAQAVIRNATGLTTGACTTAADCELSMYWARRIPAGHEPVAATAGSQASGVSALVNALQLHLYN